MGGQLPTGTLDQATYLGGNYSEEANALAIAPTTGDVYVAGQTGSIGFPGTSGGAQSVYGGDPYDAFVAHLNASLTTLDQATYLGGTDDDEAAALAIAPTTGEVYVGGTTDSTDFPGTSGGTQVFGGNEDGFIARLNASLTTLDQATYLGGAGRDKAAALAIAPTTGEVYVAGFTYSTDFPGTSGGAQSAFGGGFCDAFVARLSADLGGATNGCGVFLTIDSLCPPCLPSASSCLITRCCCATATSHRAYQDCVNTRTDALANARVITDQCAKSLQNCAANSTCGSPGKVTCCSTDKTGVTKCTIKNKPTACTPPPGGSACVGDFPSCCDACTPGGGCGTSTTTTTSSTTTTGRITTSSSTTTTTTTSTTTTTTTTTTTSTSTTSTTTTTSSTSTTTTSTTTSTTTTTAPALACGLHKCTFSGPQSLIRIYSQARVIPLVTSGA